MPDVRQGEPERQAGEEFARGVGRRSGGSHDGEMADLGDDTHVIDQARLTELRSTPWTVAGWLSWQRGDTDERKREVWNEHRRTGLDSTLRELIKGFGQPEAVAIRRR